MTDSMTIRKLTMGKLFRAIRVGWKLFRVEGTTIIVSPDNEQSVIVPNEYFFQLSSQDRLQVAPIQRDPHRREYILLPAPPSQCEWVEVPMDGSMGVCAQESPEIVAAPEQKQQQHVHLESS